MHCDTSEWAMVLQVGYIRLYLAAPIRITPPAQSLLEPLQELKPLKMSVMKQGMKQTKLSGARMISKKPLTSAAAIASYGAGKVIAMGDQHVFMNMATVHGISEGYNLEFWVAIVEKLAQRPLVEQKPKLEALSLPSKSEGGPVAVFATDSGAMGGLPELPFLANTLASLDYRVFQGCIAALTDNDWRALKVAVVFWVVPVEPPQPVLLARLTGQGSPLLVLVGDG